MARSYARIAIRPMTVSMSELEKILRTHARRYPLMQPTDAVKLIYQNEFGGEHMIRDEQACLSYLCNEYASVEKDTSISLYEEIGNDIIRVNLAAVKEEHLEQLCKTFIYSAAEHKGYMDSFQRKLEELKKLTAEGIFSFGNSELGNYLANYEKAGYPVVSHSSEYRRAYKPAYRIISKRCRSSQSGHFCIGELR